MAPPPSHSPPQSPRPAKRPHPDPEVSDVLEERLIDAEYKIWKKNTPYLYDLVMTHSLEWPSLTVQWLPQVRQLANTSGQQGAPTPAGSNGSGSEEHSLLIGTHTTGPEENHLMVASVALPRPDAAVDARAYDDSRGECGGFGAADAYGKIDVRMRILHSPGEVNRARYMPSDAFVVATRGPTGDAYVFDVSRHPSVPAGKEFCPQHVLKGHDAEGYGLAWSPHARGRLVTAGEDGRVCLFDINEGAQDVKALNTFLGHGDVVEDVSWHFRDVNLIGSVGDDRVILLWDVRSPGDSSKGAASMDKGGEGSASTGGGSKPTHKITNAHQGDINSLAFNPEDEFLFVTGSADRTVGLWDVRKMNSPMHLLNGHTDQVFQVEWLNSSVLGSCSADRRVNVWDLSRIGEEQSPEDAEDGPPELLFMHGGHTSKVSDFSWNRRDDWTVASVSEDNVLQVWHMAEEIYAGDDDDEDDVKVAVVAGQGGLEDNELE